MRKPVKSICIECACRVPPYLNYLCEECWKEALNAKLKEDEKK